MQMFDLVIRGGSVLDGSGTEAFLADVAVSDGIICAVGEVSQQGREEIDARGKIVMPGFVDIHTHFDGQVTWEHSLSPSSNHGVTTAVMGNCGVGFAPCKPDERNMLVKLMEGVEDIPEIVMTEGIPWKWETYPDYLDFLDERAFDIDCAGYLPHSALRVFVMGERGARGEPSMPADRSAMRRMVTEAVEAGALGISSSRALFHRDADGQLAPHVLSGREELLELAKGLRDAGRGVFQIASGLSSQQLKDFMTDTEPLSPEDHVRHEVALMTEIAEVAGRPLSFALTDLREAPGMFRQVLEQLAEANARGIEIRAQIFPRPIGLLFGLDLSLHPFKLHPSYRAIENLPLDERLKEMKRPEFRERLLAEEPDPDFPHPIKRFLVARSRDSYPSKDELDYEPRPANSLKAQAEREGRSIWEVAYDFLTQGEGKSILFLPMANYTGDTLDNVHEMLSHPDTLIGLGDGGAHYGLICDASFPTSMMAYWTRDRAGARLELPAVVHAMTRRNALGVGLADRGLISSGYKADINIVDYDALKLHAPEVVYDLPGKGRRIVQRAAGYVATIVSGVVTHRDGTPTGALPGRLVRLKPDTPAPIRKAA